MWGNNKNKKYGYEQKQTQIQETAHEMELVIDTFHNTLEALEEYIGKTGYYRDWEGRRQIYRKSIADSNDTVEGFEDLFLTQLLIVKASVNKKEEFFRKEVQKEYKKWISAVGINVGNCPEKLKNYLFTINEVLEGRGENFVNQTKKLVKNVKLSPQDSLKFFSELQGPLNKNAERGSLLKGKNWNQVEDEKKLSGGDIDKGEAILSQISDQVSSNSINFYDSDYYRQQGGRGGGTPPPTDDLDKVVQDVKNDPQNWSVDEMITEFNNFGGTKQEIMLIHKDARLHDYNQEGKLNFNRNPIYRWENFNSRQRFEIKRAKNISSDYLTDDEIKWVVREFKNDLSVWEIKEIEGQTYLVHNSAQIKDNEIGTLIHSKQKFNRAEWAEISEALARVNDIKQNAKLERGLFVINRETGERSENEDWFIHNSLERKIDNKTGYLIHVPNFMVRVKDLSETEKQAVGYKSEQRLQDSSVSATEKDNDKGIGAGGIFTIIGAVSALLVASVVVIKKQLNKKVKK